MGYRMLFGKLAIAVVALSASLALADSLLFTYECDALPSDLSTGLIVADPCEAPDCIESIENGHLVLQWPTGDLANFHRWISIPPEQPPASLWIEWRFRSNQPLPGDDIICDGRFSIHYSHVADGVFMLGNAVFSFETGDYLLGLELDEFHSYRFESLDGVHFRFSVDGRVFYASLDDSNFPTSYLQFSGMGDCGAVEIDRWDFVRYGTIGNAEAIVASNPPAGILDVAHYPDLNRFTVTFDQPNYVYIDDVTVEVSGGTAPSVIKTRRLDNGPPETVEIVLDRPLAVGVTTRFTFNTGGSPNSVEYTLVRSGACCDGDGACNESNEPDCVAATGIFVPDASCDTPVACCAAEGSCANLPPVCCAAEGGVSNPAVMCEGDADADGRDGVCGDRCPNDPAKISDGLCGCGVPDVDTDADTIPDCHDQCPGDDDRIDNDQNSIPDCLEQRTIPTATAWGLLVLALSLAIAAKIRFMLPSSRTR